MKLPCGVECQCDFFFFLCGMDKVMGSVQSSLLFLYYVVFSVMSVQYCLCVSRIPECIQCSVSLQRWLSYIAFNASSVQSL